MAKETHLRVLTRLDLRQADQLFPGAIALLWEKLSKMFSDPNNVVKISRLELVDVKDPAVFVKPTDQVALHVELEHRWSEKGSRYEGSTSDHYYTATSKRWTLDWMEGYVKARGGASGQSPLSAEKIRVLNALDAAIDATEGHAQHVSLAQVTSAMSPSHRKGTARLLNEMCREGLAIRDKMRDGSFGYTITAAGMRRLVESIDAGRCKGRGYATGSALDRLEREAPLSNSQAGFSAGSSKQSYRVTLFGVGGEKVKSRTVKGYSNAKEVERAWSEDHAGDGMFALIED